MATNIDFRHYESGVTLTLELRDYGTGDHALVNPTSTATAVIDAVDDPRRYRCEISEDIAVGWYVAEWFEDGDLVGAGSVYVSAANTGTYEVGSVPAALSQAADVAIQKGVSTFDPASDTVARVTLVDTCTENTDMRGTDGAVTSLSGVASSTDVSDAAQAVISAIPDVSDLALEATSQSIKTKTDAIPSAIDNATAVWSASTRTLSSFGTLVADIATAVWSATTRTLSGFTHKVTVETNEDKAGYSLETSPPSKEAIAGQVRTELTTELGMIDAAVSSRLASTTAGRTLNVEEDGTIAVSVDEGVLTEAVETAVNNAVGDGVLISDASVAKLAGTVVRFVSPAWSSTGFKEPFVCGVTYSGDLRPSVSIKNWSGSQDLGDAISILFSGVRSENCEAAGFEFDLGPESVSVEGDIVTISVGLTTEQTAGVEPGKYHCDLIAEWSNGEKVALFAESFSVTFRAVNKV